MFTFHSLQRHRPFYKHIQLMHQNFVHINVPSLPSYMLQFILVYIYTNNGTPHSPIQVAFILNQTVHRSHSPMSLSTTPHANLQTHPINGQQLHRHKYTISLPSYQHCLPWCIYKLHMANHTLPFNQPTFSHVHISLSSTTHEK